MRNVVWKPNIVSRFKKSGRFERETDSFYSGEADFDVAVRLHSIRNMDVEALEKLGYDYCGPREGRDTYHLFVLHGENQISLRHIHCYDGSDKEFFQLVGFRDYLNSHPDAAKEYSELKEKLARLYPKDRIAYTKGKEYL